MELLIEYLKSDSNILARVLYQDLSIVELIGDVICPNKKCRREKSVYITSFEEINKSTYECRQCKARTHLLSILFKDQEPCVTLFGVTLEKKYNVGLPKRGTLASNATVHQPIKPLHDKRRGR